MTTIPHTLKSLKSLAGMKHRNGHHTADYWTERTGTDPRSLPGYIHTTKAGLCIWTDKAERIIERAHNRTRRNWQSVGV